MTAMVSASPLRVSFTAGLALTLTVSACTTQPELSAPQPPLAAVTTTSASTVSPLVQSTSSTLVPCKVEAPALENPWTTASATALDHSGFEGLEVSASFWVEGIGEVVAQNPDLELFPASNQKIYTALGGLSLVDPGNRFVTSVELVGATLVLRAGGDPTLRSSGSHSLTELANQVSQAVSSEVDRLVVDAGYFEPNTSVSGRQDWQLPAYTGPLSALIIDDNRWREDDDFLQNPAFENGKLFAEKLRHAGLTVPSVEHIDNFNESGDVVASLESAPVAELLKKMLRASDNEIAESILREIGGGSTASGIEIVDESFDELCPAILGQSGDGSGLSRANLRSSRNWRQLLQLALAQDSTQELFDLLPVAGKTGTMSSRLTGTSTAGNVRAKTGTIIGGRALSGYAETADGRLMVFSVVTNGEPGTTAKSVAAIDNLVQILVSTTL